MTGWDAKATTANTDEAEWVIPLELVSMNLCSNFGIAVYHQSVMAAGDDYGWPSNQFYDSPKTWQEARLEGIDVPCGGKIAYVYRVDAPMAVDFKTMLEARGYTVQLVPLPTVLATNFAPFDLVIIADDTGSLNDWPSGVGGVSPAADWIRAAGRPVLGLGEGGYAYFGKHGVNIGWPNGWHGPLDRVTPVNVGISYWHTPNNFAPAPPSPFGVYTGPVNEVGIYLPAAPTALVFGMEPTNQDHAPLIAEGRQQCNQLWGFSGGPNAMTASGKDLFENAVVFGISSHCPTQPTYPEDCLTVTKSAVPPANTLVSVNAVIQYKLQYAVKDLAACRLSRAVLEDSVPEHTLFVPGSASDGSVPGADGVLRWDLAHWPPAPLAKRYSRSA